MFYLHQMHESIKRSYVRDVSLHELMGAWAEWYEKWEELLISRSMKQDKPTPGDRQNRLSGCNKTQTKW